MRVLHIISSLKRGGAENLLVQLIGELQRKGVHNSVIYFHEGPHLHDLQKLGVSCVLIKGYFFRYDPIFFIRLWHSIKKIKPDCIHGSLWMANITSRICAKLLHIAHINSIHNNIDQDGFFRNMLDKYTFNFSSRLVAVSPGVLNSLNSVTYKTPTDIITNGINYAQVVALSQQSLMSRTDIGLHEHHFVIGSVGRFVPIKNYPLLIDAFKLLLNQVSHARLVLLGAGPEELKLRKYVRQLGLDPFVHFIIGKQAYGYYPIFDCFCLSSYKEGISIALLEAMSLKKACITTHYHTEHDVIQNGINGMIVSSYEPSDLMNALLKLTNPILRKTLEAKAQSTIHEKFSIETMTEAYYKLYTNAMTQEALTGF